MVPGQVTIVVKDYGHISKEMQFFISIDKIFSSFSLYCAGIGNLERWFLNSKKSESVEDLYLK